MGPPRRTPDPTVPRTVGALALLGLMLPINLTVVATAMLVGAGRTRRRSTAPGARTIMLSGGKMTKALQLARSFHQAGHRVVLVESSRYRLTGHRFSRAVDAFHVVPSPGDSDYVDALLRIVHAEQVDVYVPVCSPAASYFDALAKERLLPHCEVVHIDPDVLGRLDDKYEFSVLAAAAGLPIPDTHLITSPEQVADFDFSGSDRTYILKSIAYDPVARLDLTTLPRPSAEETAQFARGKPISADNPWILQEFVTGTEYCTHSTVRHGHTQVYCCCESSAFQLNYAMVDKPAIEAWVTRFCEGLGLTGQVSFDFIERADGALFAIECNPRTHSAITMMYDHPDLARAYLEDGVPMIRPRPSSRPTYWLYQELWRLLRSPRGFRERLRIVLRGKDAIFDRDDPIPFLMVHHLQIPALLIGNLRRRAPWVRIDFNIGKLVEPAGD
jgi:predicted ATP-grasp superfamily ATP-dependent carboligase